MGRFSFQVFWTFRHQYYSLLLRKQLFIWIYFDELCLSFKFFQVWLTKSGSYWIPWAFLFLLTPWSRDSLEGMIYIPQCLIGSCFFTIWPHFWGNSSIEFFLMWYLAKFRNYLNQTLILLKEIVIFEGTRKILILIILTLVIMRSTFWFCSTMKMVY